MNYIVPKNSTGSTYRMHPKKFAMWLFLISVTMLFAALTSAYIVRKADGNWFSFDLPAVLWINTAVILMSSIFMQLAYVAAKKDNLEFIKIMLSATTVLGLAFVLGQWKAWQALVGAQIFFQGNPSGSFLYVLTGVHVAHLLGGVVFLLTVLIQAFQYKVHSVSLLSISMCNTYWHFLDGLWLYLFLFLLANH